MGVVIWINGCFGVGKTTAAEKLSGRLRGAHIYDPELTGEFLWSCLPPDMSRQGDFQDIPLWRSINRQVIYWLWQSRNGDIIVPMTLVNRRYYDEIIGWLGERGVPVLHVILTASRDRIVERLRGRGEKSGSWPEEQIDRCLAAYESGAIPGGRVDTECLDARSVVDALLSERRKLTDSFSV